MRRYDSVSSQCASQPPSRLAAKFANVTHLSPSVVAGLQTEGSVVLVDVRTPEEGSLSRLSHSLIVEEYEAREAEYKAKNTQVVAYCTVGYRSAQYAGQLQKRGVNAANMAGSILAWVSSYAPHPPPPPPLFFFFF